MQVAVIGTGYVGLVSGACLAELGASVTCIDKEESKITCLLSGSIPIYEPGLEEIVHRNRKNGRLSFSSSLQEGVKDADIVLLAVGTPMREGDGRADLQYVFAAAAEVAKSLTKSAVIVTKSTVPVGTGRQVAKILAENAPHLSCAVVSNPEFLREGAAVEDFMQPDRVVIGSDDREAAEKVRKLYVGLEAKGASILITALETAELIKYAANGFLATKIAFINEMADICEKVGADITEVALGMGLDKRIGKQFLVAGPGFGGSCFPKDTVALSYIARDAGAVSRITEAVIETNNERQKHMARKVIAACGGSVRGKKIGIWGVAFKANTDDVRLSPALVIMEELLKEGAWLQAYDPVAMENGKREMETVFAALTHSVRSMTVAAGAEITRFESGQGMSGSISWCADKYAAAADAEAVVVITEWAEFKEVDPEKLCEIMNQPIMVDLRNICEAITLTSQGVTYYGVGKKFPQ